LSPDVSAFDTAKPLFPILLIVVLVSFVSIICFVLEVYGLISVSVSHIL
jgi:hypothetical protein